MGLSTIKIVTLAFGVFALSLGACAASSDKGNQPLQSCSAPVSCYEKCVCGGGENQACLDGCASSSSGGSAGNGGTGNTSNGGTGNAGSCDAAVQFQTPACGACASAACCPELQRCFGTSQSTSAPNCGLLLNCMQEFCADSANDNTAFQNCVNQECADYLDQESIDAYGGLDCVDTNCASECAG
ncbi:MAG: hypothetical protein R3B89_01915 [Polyangiaceae bacterium]